MRRSRRSADRAAGERGSASLEFLVAGLLLLVPMVYLVLALAAVQAGTLAVDGAARQASRVYVQSPTPEAATDAAARAVEVTLGDYGLEGIPPEVRISCRPRAAACLTRHGFVTVSVRVVIPLPLAPVAVDPGLPAGIPVEATATEQVSRFRGSW